MVITGPIGAPRAASSSGVLDERAVWNALQSVQDPEIPVVSVVDLGIVQAVRLTDLPETGRRVEVDITPTFSGCPALDLMRLEIAEALRGIGAAQVEVRVVLSPPWTSDRISAGARERMKAIGISPPAPMRSGGTVIALSDIDVAAPHPAPAHSPETLDIACPFCGSADTVLENAFGPTICREIRYCRACQQPFERFKAL